MDITFNELKNKEIINIYDGRRLGRASDICFEKESNQVTGIIIPGEHKLFKKSEDLFVPISKIKKIGEDVLLIKLAPEIEESPYKFQPTASENKVNNSRPVYAKYRRVVQKEK